MTICIFMGPSLGHSEALSIYPEAKFLPPAEKGSIVAATHRFSPTAIGVVDGYFQHRASLWHKEILWAMDQGISVYGGASMGALRAAELEAYGMIGVGVVFNAFKQGALPPFEGLSDDDEVAILHGPAELGYVTLTDAMVNIRYTIDAAVKSSVIDASIASNLLEIAKQLYFPDRTYKRIIETARDRPVCTDALDRFEAWIPNGAVDQKRADAIELVQTLAALKPQENSRHDPTFYFETTEIWRDSLPGMLAEPFADESLSQQYKLILDELRLNEQDYVFAKQQAMVRYVIAHPHRDWSHNSHLTQGIEMIERQISDEFRQRNKLLDRERVDHWLEANELDITEYDALIHAEVPLEHMLQEPDSSAIETLIISQLRLLGTYPELSARAQHKQRLLAETSAAVQPAAHVAHWFFEDRHRRSVPSDLHHYARRLGLANGEELLVLLDHEYQFLMQKSVDKFDPFCDS